jgi:ABC-type Mn2+/Zn2+ transport system permease subunit
MVIGVCAVGIGLTLAYYVNLAPGGAIVLAAAGFFLLTSSARVWTGR